LIKGERGGVKEREAVIDSLREREREKGRESKKERERETRRCLWLHNS